eukprot:1068090-Rhodomonas_salina.1
MSRTEGAYGATSREESFKYWQGSLVTYQPPYAAKDFLKRLAEENKRLQAELSRAIAVQQHVSSEHASATLRDSEAALQLEELQSNLQYCSRHPCTATATSTAALVS